MMSKNNGENTEQAQDEPKPKFPCGKIRDNGEKCVEGDMCYECCDLSRRIIKSDETHNLPEFKTEYFWAFCALMLYKVGGFEIIKLEQLEKFDFENDCPQVTWDAKNKAFIMRNKDVEMPKAVAVPGKIRKKLFRKLMKDKFS